MTADELEEQIERAVNAYSQIEGVSEELAQRLVEQGYLSYDDLSVIEPEALMELGGLSEEEVERIVEIAEARAEEAEEAAAEERRVRRERQGVEENPPESDLSSEMPVVDSVISEDNATSGGEVHESSESGPADTQPSRDTDSSTGTD